MACPKHKKNNKGRALHQKVPWGPRLGWLFWCVRQRSQRANQR